MARTEEHNIVSVLRNKLNQCSKMASCFEKLEESSLFSTVINVLQEQRSHSRLLSNFFLSQLIPATCTLAGIINIRNLPENASISRQEHLDVLSKLEKEKDRVNNLKTRNLQISCITVPEADADFARIKNIVETIEASERIVGRLLTSVKKSLAHLEGGVDVADDGDAAHGDDNYDEVFYSDDGIAEVVEVIATNLQDYVK